jgi:hypothetical protein
LEETDVDHLRCAMLEHGSLVGVVDIDRIFSVLAREAIA